MTTMRDVYEAAKQRAGFKANRYENERWSCEEDSPYKEHFEERRDHYTDVQMFCLHKLAGKPTRAARGEDTGF